VETISAGAVLFDDHNYSAPAHGNKSVKFEVFMRLSSKLQH